MFLLVINNDSINKNNRKISVYGKVLDIFVKELNA